ncbi:MAG: glycosyltransferase family 39 protein [bacterium]|nr:glycosyltransferase family 39 protein [bacterium]
MENITVPGKNRQNYVIILAICLLAGIIRIVNLDFLLDYFEIPDEYIWANLAVHVDPANLFCPLSFKYGSFPVYWSALIFKIFYYISWLFTGEKHSFYALIPVKESVIDPSLYYLGRLTSVLFGIASIYVMFLTVKKLFGEKAGYWSAFLMSISPLHVLSSQLFKVDMSLLFLLLLCVYLSLLIIEERKTKHYLLAGILVGLAVSTKYYFFLMVPVFVAYWQTEKVFSRALIKPILCINAALLTFFLTCPYCFFDLNNLIRQILNELVIQRYAFSKDPIELAAYLIGQAAASVVLIFPLLFNPLLYVLALAGGRQLFAQKRQAFILLISLPLVYFLMVETQSGFVMLPQHILPLYPFVIIFCSYYIANNVRKIASVKSILLAAFLVYEIVNLTAPFASYRVYIHQYEKLGQWIEKEIPAGSRVIGYYGFLIPSEKLNFVRENRIKWTDSFDLRTLEEVKPDYIVMEIADSVLKKDYEKMYQVLKKDTEHYEIRKIFKMPITELAGKIIRDENMYEIYIFQKKR